MTTLYERPGLRLYETPTIAPQAGSLRLQVETWNDVLYTTLTPQQAIDIGDALRAWGFRARLKTASTLR